MVWLFSRSCRSQARLDGKTVVITGGNCGLGKETALDLAGRGARVVIAVRDTARGEEAAAEIHRHLVDARAKDPRRGPHGEVLVEQLDLASLQSVRACAQRLLRQEKSIHILVNNAGVMACPKAYTKDGHDLQFGVNHLGHFLLTLLLLPRIRASAKDAEDPARIVTVASLAYMFSRIDFDDLRFESNYSPLPAYARSKLANILFTRELARRLKEAEVDNVRTYCLHPGAVATKLFRHFDTFIIPGTRFLVNHVGSYFIKTPKQGAQTSIYCAVDEKAAKESGLYYTNCSVTTPFAFARDDAVALRLWEVSVDLVGLKGYDPLAVSEAPEWAFQQTQPQNKNGDEQGKHDAKDAAGEESASSLTA